MVLIPHILFSAFISLCYALACTGLGLCVLKWLVGRAMEEKESAAARLVTAFFLGLGCLVALWTFLSLAGWFSPAAIVVVLLLSGAGFLTVRKDAKAILRASSYAVIRFAGLPVAWRLIIALISLVALEQAASCFLPVTGDAAGFYMVIAKTMAASHRLTPLSGYQVFTCIGLFGEFHYGALISIAGPDSAKFLVFLIALATAGLIAAMGRRIGLGWRGQIMAVAMVFTSTAFTFVIGDGKVDLFGASLAVAAYYWAMESGKDERDGDRALLLTGLFTGLAILAKLTYMPVLLPGVLLIVLWRRILQLPDRHAVGRIIGVSVTRAGLMLFWTAFALIPMVVKNAVLFGAPLAPFLGLGGAGFILSQSWVTPEAARWILLTYPLALTFGAHPMQYGNISPLALAFCPLVLKLPRPRSFLRSSHVQVAIGALIGVVIWAFLKPSVFAPRYFLAPLLVLSLPVAAAAEHLTGLKGALSYCRRMFVAGCVIFVLLVSLRQFTVVHPVAVPYLQGRVSECDYIAQPCQGAKVINSLAKTGERAFLLNYYTYYLRPDILLTMGGPADIKEKDLSVSQLWGKMYSLGFRYVFVDGSSYATWDRWLADPSQRPQSLSIETVFHEGTYTIYRLSQKNGEADGRPAPTNGLDLSTGRFR